MSAAAWFADAWGTVSDAAVEGVGYLSDAAAEDRVRAEQETREIQEALSDIKEGAVELGQKIAAAPKAVADALRWLPAVAVVVGVLGAAVGVAYVVRSFR